MTPKPDRLAEIRTRDVGRTAEVVPERYLMAAPPFTPTPGPEIELAKLRARADDLLSQNAELLAQAKESAGMLREALTGPRQCGYTMQMDAKTVRCDFCGEMSPTLAKHWAHTPSCLITRLRAQADIAEGERCQHLAPTEANDQWHKAQRGELGDRTNKNADPLAGADVVDRDD